MLVDGSQGNLEAKLHQLEDFFADSYFWTAI